MGDISYSRRDSDERWIDLWSVDSLDRSPPKKPRWPRLIVASLFEIVDVEILLHISAYAVCTRVVRIVHVVPGRQVHSSCISALAFLLCVFGGGGGDSPSSHQQTHTTQHNNPCFFHYSSRCHRKFFKTNSNFFFLF